MLYAYDLKGTCKLGRCLTVKGNDVQRGFLPFPKATEPANGSVGIQTKVCSFLLATVNDKKGPVCLPILFPSPNSSPFFIPPLPSLLQKKEQWQWQMHFDACWDQGDRLTMPKRAHNHDNNTKHTVSLIKHLAHTPPDSKLAFRSYFIHYCISLLGLP